MGTGAGGGIAAGSSSARRACTALVSVIWQLSSALKETFLKETDYILLSPLHFLDRLAKGGMFPLSHSLSHPLFFFF